MNRRQLIEKCFQRGEQLTIADTAYREGVNQFLSWLIANDHIENDVTTKALNLQHRTKATVQAKQTGILAGLEEVLFLLQQYPEITVEVAAKDGATLTKGQTILTLSLDVGELLRLERTVLNVIGRLSGIATQTNHLIKLFQQNPEAPLIAGTRKTPWMMLDKKGVYVGGGLTHRLSLSDSILVKDNHLAAFQKQSNIPGVEQTIPSAIELLVQASTQRGFFEIEVETPEQGRAALSAFETVLQNTAQQSAMVVMLDNFGPVPAAEFINEARNSPVYERVLFEASGDITEETIPSWAKTGVDVVSLGALTHSVKIFNVSMALC